VLLALHSIARWCYLHHIPVIPKLIKAIIFVIFNCLLPAECSIGPGTRLHHHGWCIGFHESVEIGRDCNIYNQVEIGGGHDGPDGPPIRIIIGDRVNICTGAKVCCISGTLTIGEGSTVGANAVVTSDVPPHSLAIGIPARCIPKKQRREAASKGEERLRAAFRMI
jgi:serine O-acetyltransferase